MTDVERGSITYITGGTTGFPKLIEYSSARFDASIRTKQRMLSECGVCQASRVAVLHPMAPWSIGEVFSQGAVRCGANVIPLGISLHSETLVHLLLVFQPTVICGGGRNLLRNFVSVDPAIRSTLFGQLKLVLTAGEKLTTSARNEIRETFGCPVRDIYGCAELDALGVENLDGNGLRLVSDFEYRLRCDQDYTNLRAGLIGILEARRLEPPSDWCSTQDIVKVLEEGFGGFEVPQPSIEVIDRVELRVKFGDGSAIGSGQLALLQEQLKLMDLQLVVRRSITPPDRVTVLYLPQVDRECDSQAVIDGLLRVSADFADAYVSGCIGELVAQRVDSELNFHATERGKAPRIFVIEEGR